MAEETDSKGLSSKLKSYLNEAPFFCKIIELVFCVITIGLIIDPYNNNMQEDLNHAGIVYVAICGYILINSIQIYCYLIGEKMPKQMALIFSGMGAILCLVAGSVLLYDWDNFQSNLISKYLQQYLNQMIASGVFAILAGLTFVLDTYLLKKIEE